MVTKNANGSEAVVEDTNIDPTNDGLHNGNQKPIKDFSKQNDTIVTANANGSEAVEEENIDGLDNGTQKVSNNVQIEIEDVEKVKEDERKENDEPITNGNGEIIFS